MARSAGIVIANNLAGGLVSEATGLNFPENAATDTLNCVFTRTGTVRRRNGFGFEAGYETKTIDKNQNAINYYFWKSAGSGADSNVMVLQVGMSIHFYIVGGGTGSLSSGAHQFTIDLNTYYVGGSNPNQQECSFSSGLGYLFITHPNVDPLYVIYNSDSNTFTVTMVTVEIRDFEGTSDGLDWDERPTTLSNAHNYNLYNQGWYQRVLNAAGFGSQAIAAWRNDGRTSRGDYPSNADVWWYFKGPYPLGTDDVIGSNSEYFRNVLVSTVAIGNSPAPKGHYLLDLHRQDRSGVSGIPGIPVKASSDSRVSCNAFFAGRVFYSGLGGEGYIGKVYFTQIIERKEQLGACYQQMDPTAEGNSDLLPSDGGVISIADCGLILRMQPVGNSLVIWASNGVWAIAGSEGIGFRANDYAVTKISSTTVLSSTNFIDVEGTPMWWNQNGIYGLNIIDQAGSMNVVSVSDERIKSFLDNIPVRSKTYVKGYYNSFSQTIHWLYRSTSPETVSDRYTYDRVLIYDIALKCFYLWALPDSEISFHGIVVVDGLNYSFIDEEVTDELGEVVTDESEQPITVTIAGESPNVGVFKYLVYQEGAFTFAEARDLTHVDWSDQFNLSFPSYVDFGYKIHGEGMRKFQPTYISLFSENRVPTTFDFFAKWNWANSGTTGKWSSIQRIVSDPSTYDVSTARRKIRGHGVALQLRLQSVDNEPFSLIGYTIYETGNQTP